MREPLERRLVAVMFTDMVGYTALMQHDEAAAVAKRDRYVAALLAAHDEFDGTIVQRLGDGSMSMFANAYDAVRAGEAMQCDLVTAGVEARVGIHVGEVVVEPERLTGSAVNVAARIESFGVAGSVLLSDTAAEQIANRRELTLRNLGPFRFKNVERSFTIYALEAAGLVTPALDDMLGKGDRVLRVSFDVGNRGESLFGRDDDLAALTTLLAGNRLVTITGPGGVGKTSVMAALGRRSQAQFGAGVAFVSLVDVAEVANFMPFLAAALDVKEAPERTFAEGLATQIGDNEVLLLLDNLEQIPEAGVEIAQLLDACSHLSVVVTSRRPLHVTREVEYSLAPLAVPEAASFDNLAVLQQYAAVELFVNRASKVRPGFALTSDNATAIAGICTRLDGLPLAIELAAARTRLLAPQALFERLGRVLDVLTTGARDLHSRQQTLRATIDWSYSLLSESEQRLFTRLAVFSDGSSIESVEAVCGLDDDFAIDDLESLVDKAMVVLDAESGRLRMLQTIWEFASDTLRASGAQPELARRHALHYAAVAREIGRGIEGESQLASLDRGVADEANLIAALDFLLAAARGGEAEAREVGMTMTGDLLMFWHLRGKNLSARDYAQAFLATDSGATQTRGRAGALMTAGLASWMLGRLEQANAEWAEAYDIAGRIESERLLASVSAIKGLGFFGVDVEAGLATTAESIVRCREQSLPWWGAFAATLNGMFLIMRSDLDEGERVSKAAHQVQLGLGDAEGAGLSASAVASVATARGDHLTALEWHRVALASFAACHDRAEEARVLAEIAWSYLAVRDLVAARDYFIESIQAYTDVVSARGVGLSLVGLASVQSLLGNAANAVTLSTAAELLAQQGGIVNVYGDDSIGREHIDSARAQLTSDDCVRAEASGQQLSLADALELALVV